MRDAYWVVVANAGRVDLTLLSALSERHSIVVCDGAYQQVMRSAVKVDVLIGDFDSISSACLQQAQSDPSITVVKAVDQNKTDLEKAIEYLVGRQAKGIMIVNAASGAVGHSLYNLRLLRNLHRSHCALSLLDANETVRFVCNARVSLQGSSGSSVSVFGFPQATLSSHGLQYDVDAFVLGYQGRDSVSNAMRLSQAELFIEGEALLVVDSQVAVQST